MELYSIFIYTIYKMFDRKEISQRLKAAREALPNPVNATQFAKRAKGVDESQYSKFEKGGPMGNKKIMELCSVWGISVDWVYRGEGGMFVGQVPAAPPKEKPGPSKGRAKGIEERIEEIDDRSTEIEVSLRRNLANQDGLLQLVTVILYRDCLREAKGNEEKAEEILDEILRRTLLEQYSHLKKGIRVDGHKEGMGNP